MKTYNDYMQELTSADVYKGLVAYGLFPERMPPVFTSEAFYNYCNKLVAPFSNVPHTYAYYENIRNINIPRPMGIPVPMAYQRLCRHIADNWQEIQNYFQTCTRRDNHCVSRIHVRKMFNTDKIFDMNYDDWRNDPDPDTDLQIGAKYAVHVDVSKCFPSIYTHAIPWALVGKTAAKQKLKGTWYNELDHRLQFMKDRETHGLLIGPHASNIISEILLCKIDSELTPRWKYVRHIDDYICYVMTEEEADEFIAELQTQLRAYDLSLNHKKTKIEKLPIAAIERWIRKINSISIITSYGKVDFKNCRTYLDYAIEIAQSHNWDASVLKYAIKVLAGKELTDNAKAYEQKTIFHLCLMYPYLVPLLDPYVFGKCGTTPADICFIANKIYDTYSRLKIYEPMSYALYFAAKYGFEITGVNVPMIIDIKDATLLTMSFIYYKKHKNKTAIRDLKAFARVLDEKEFEQLWYFAYEILPAKDLKKEWKGMKQARVSFLVDL